MNNKIIENEYKRWLEFATDDNDLINELNLMADSEDKIEDAFYKNLEFGTGGLRGVIGAGTNRMNIYTVAKASQGLANYVKSHFQQNDWKIAVSYDSRIKSDLFAQIASGVFAANNIQVYIYTELMPTPCLSYAVRELKCAGGIMITASHNPAKYNGYKVYGSDGCQITTKAAADILAEINMLDIFNDVKKTDFQQGINKKFISYIPEHIYDSFIENVKSQTMLLQDDEIDRNVSIVYSPLNGTGLKPVMRALTEAGYTNINVVKEQELPDGNFPTCPYPNPEVKEAMALGMEYASKYNADILLATDPDCDRVGIAVRNNNNDYVLLSGNETGILLFNYICERLTEIKKMPVEPVMVKTIVTTDMAGLIAANYGVYVKNVLTGFKFIGEQIGLLENTGKEDSYIFGFEESYGYLSGTYVRDKDAVNGAFMICEMFAYYNSKGLSLIDKLYELYSKYGYFFNTLHSYQFEGSAGFAKMQQIMESFRTNITSFGTKNILQCLDYRKGLDGLPQSNVLKFMLDSNCSVVIRPSGTEPKIKIYMSVAAESKEKAETEEKLLLEYIEKCISDIAKD